MRREPDCVVFYMIAFIKSAYDIGSDVSKLAFFL